MKKLIIIFLIASMLLNFFGCKKHTFSPENAQTEMLQVSTMEILANTGEQDVCYGIEGLTTDEEYLVKNSIDMKENHCDTIDEYYNYLYFRSSKDATFEDFNIVSNVLIKYNGEYKGNVKIPEGVQKIYHMSFMSKDTNIIDSLYIPESVININRQINTFANVGNGNFKKYKVSEKNKYFSDLDGILCNKAKDVILKCPNYYESEKYVIPDNIKKIDINAFEETKMLKEVVFNDKLFYIPNGAFFRSSIERITIPKNITVIGDGAFKDCTKLKEIVIESGVRYIGGGAFDSCSQLKSLEIPYTVEGFGGNLIQNCDNLEYIIIPSSVKKIDGKLYDEKWDYKYKGFLYVEKGSYAEKYVKENGYKYKYYDFEKNQVIS